MSSFAFLAQHFFIDGNENAPGHARLRLELGGGLPQAHAHLEPANVEEAAVNLAALLPPEARYRVASALLTGRVPKPATVCPSCKSSSKGH